MAKPWFENLISEGKKVWFEDLANNCCTLGTIVGYYRKYHFTSYLIDTDEETDKKVAKGLVVFEL